MTTPENKFNFFSFVWEKLLFCKQDGNNGGSKMCHKTGVVYKYSCQNDGYEATCVGETSKVEVKL